jgi:carbon catabolite-derepressing protein kinase
LINRAKITTPDMNARVKREIQYLKVLRHPHIIKLYEVITTPTDVIMVMEYAGEELFNYIISKGKGGVSYTSRTETLANLDIDARIRSQAVLPADDRSYRVLSQTSYCSPGSEAREVSCANWESAAPASADGYSLFLDSRNNIKIGDFGLSNLMTDGDFLKTSCGSPNYAAPEVISGKSVGWCIYA